MEIKYKNNEILDIYPVGSIFITSSSENPEIKFGGTWQRISNSVNCALACCLDSSGFFYGTSPSSNTTSLSLIKHNHLINEHSHTFASHTHTCGNKYFIGVSGGVADSIKKVTNLSSGTNNFCYRGSLSGQTNLFAGNINSHDVTTVTSNSTSANTGSTGSGTSFNIVPAYKAAYMWKRIS